MAAITSTQSGNWSSGSTWVGGVVPSAGNGDTANIANGHTVTVDVDTTIGASGTSLVAAVTLNTSGALSVASGVTFVVRGSVIQTGDYGATATAITLAAGSTWEWDASQAASPSTTHYRYCADNYWQYRKILINGTSGSRVTVRSNASGGAGAFIFDPSYVFGLYLVATYADFLRIGDADTAGFYVYYHDEANKVRWDVSNCTFTDCGIVQITGESAADAVYRHENNVHANSLGSVSALIDAVSANSGGTRVISGNAFDKAVGDGNGQLRDFTIENNYLGAELLALQGSLYTACSSNFICKANQAEASAAVRGPFLNNVMFSAWSLDNPHWMYHDLVNSLTISGNIFDPGGADTSSDGGDVILSSNGSVAITVTVENNLVLPGTNGRTAGCMVTMFGDCPNTSFAVNHNTVYVDRQGIVDFETGTLVAGTLLSFKSNIVWALSANASASYKILDFTAGTEDVADPADCDYNVGWNYNTTNKGYDGSWSSGPAATHDIDTDPAFVDVTRNTATWDSAYLGNAPATWDSHGSGDTFAVGDFASNADAGVYAGAVVNYRCILEHTKSTANSEPGVGSAWRTYWEYASLYRIRQAVAAGTVYEPDVPNGLTEASTVIPTLRSWIRTGFAPMNALLLGAAHDATDIGAVPVASATNYTLAVDSTSVALTATAITFARSLVLPVSGASVALTPTSVGLAVSRVVSVAAESVAISAQDIAFSRSLAVQVSLASVTLEPTAVGLQRSLALSVDAASVTITSTAIELAVSRVIAVDSAALGLTTTDITLTKTGAISLIVDSASVAVTPTDVALSRSLVLPVGATSIALTPTDVGFARSLVLGVEIANVSTSATGITLAASRVVSIDSATIAVTPQDIALTQTGSYTLPVDAASVTLAASDVALARSLSVAVDPASVMIIPADVTFARSLSLGVTAAQLQVATQDVMLAASRALAVAASSVSVTPQDVTLTVSESGVYSLSVDTVAITLSVTAIGLESSRLLAVATASVTAAPTDVMLTRSLTIGVDPAAVAVSAQPVGLVGSFALPVVAASVAVSTSDVDLWHIYEIAVESAAIDIGVSPIELAVSRVLAVAGAAVALTPTNITLTFTPFVAFVPEERTKYMSARNWLFTASARGFTRII